MDVGWKNGVGADDVYDNWPLSKQWQWYDAIVPLDDETVGTGGAGTRVGRERLLGLFHEQDEARRLLRDVFGRAGGRAHQTLRDRSGEECAGHPAAQGVAQPRAVVRLGAAAGP